MPSSRELLERGAGLGERRPGGGDAGDGGVVGRLRGLDLGAGDQLLRRHRPHPLELLLGVDPLGVGAAHRRARGRQVGARLGDVGLDELRVDAGDGRRSPGLPSFSGGQAPGASPR
jgi:hypothetical protein